MQRVSLRPRFRLHLERVGFGAALAEEIDHRRRIRRRHEDIDIWQALPHPERIAHADHAAHDTDHFVRLRFFDFAKKLQAPQPLVLGALPHDAGVHNHNVRVIAVGGGAMAQFLQLGGQQLRIGHVHLTAVGPDVILHGISLYLFGAYGRILVDSGGRVNSR